MKIAKKIIATACLSALVLTTSVFADDHIGITDDEGDTNSATWYYEPYVSEPTENTNEPVDIVEVIVDVVETVIENTGNFLNEQRENVEGAMQPLSAEAGFVEHGLSNGTLGGGGRCEFEGYN